MIGFQSGATGPVSGTNNTFLGRLTGNSTTSGNNNTFIGNTSGTANTTGEFNTYVGAEAGFLGTTGPNNTFIGYQAGYNNTTGTNITALGYQAGPTGPTQSNTLWLNESIAIDGITGPLDEFIPLCYNQSTGQVKPVVVYGQITGIASVAFDTADTAYNFVFDNINGPNVDLVSSTGGFLLDRIKLTYKGTYEIEFKPRFGNFATGPTDFCNTFAWLKTGTEETGPTTNVDDTSMSISTAPGTLVSSSSSFIIVTTVDNTYLDIVGATDTAYGAGEIGIFGSPATGPYAAAPAINVTIKKLY
jgi:hypothetical protein